MNTMYTIGDEVRISHTGEFGKVINDSNSENGFYDVRLDNGVEYTFHISELN